MNLRALLVAFALAACDGIGDEAEETGPGGSCDLAEDCVRSFSIAIARPDRAPLPAATYEIAIELDGSAYTTVCTSLDDGRFHCEAVAGPDTFELAASGTQGALFIEVTDTGIRPDALHLVVTSGDAPLADHMQELHYREPDDFEPCAAAECIAADDVTVEVDG